MSHEAERGTLPPSPGISKRAALRLIQRALVLAARTRSVRQHIRQAELTSTWTIQDWGLEWAVSLRRGRLDFDRRLPRQPDIRVSWPTAAAFFDEGERPNAEVLKPQCGGPPTARAAWDVVYRAFRTELRDLIQHPVDADGRSLL